MEKRDTLDGRNGKTGGDLCHRFILPLGRLGFGVMPGGDPLEDVGRGNNGKSSSHSNPAP